jgi:hypothetical protein
MSPLRTSNDIVEEYLATEEKATLFVVGVCFFCEYTLGFEWNSRKVPKMKLYKKLPLILTKEEVNIYINSFVYLKYKAIVSSKRPITWRSAK